MLLRSLIFICLIVDVISIKNVFTIKYLEKLHGLPPIEVQSRAIIPEDIFMQKVDNFDESNNDTYPMVYRSNLEFYKPGGPIFIMIGGEWVINSGYIQGGQMYDNAKMNNGAMFYTQHRYYGKSRPTKDASTDNLKYLSVEQALADLAEFIKYQKKELNVTKVIVFGGSYAGNLAAWARLKYPDLILGAVASSGPVLAKADFYEYLEVVNDAIYNRDKDCFDVLQSAMKQVEKLIQSDSGVANISNTFNLCSDLKRSDQHAIYLFYLSITGIFSNTVQYATKKSIQEECQKLKNSIGASDMEKLASYTKIKYNNFCLSIDYKNYVNYMKQSDWNTIKDGIARQWTYQTCTEFGYFQITGSSHQPFGTQLPLDFSVDLCRDIFGISEETLYAGINKTNKMYGAKNPPTTNVIFTNGDVDPWHRLGILKLSTNRKYPISSTILPNIKHTGENIRPIDSIIPNVIDNTIGLLPYQENTNVVHFISGTSHCADLSSLSVSDNVQMKDAKLSIQANIMKWLKE